MTNEKIYQIQERLREKLAEAEKKVQQYDGRKTETLRILKDQINRTLQVLNGKSLDGRYDDAISSLAFTQIRIPLTDKVSNIIGLLYNSQFTFGTRTSEPVKGTLGMYRFRTNRVEEPLEQLAGDHHKIRHWAGKIPDFRETYGRKIEERTLTREEFAQMLTILASNQSLRYPKYEEHYNKNLKTLVAEFAQDRYTDGKPSISPAILKMIDANIERCSIEDKREREALIQQHERGTRDMQRATDTLGAIVNMLNK